MAYNYPGVYVEEVSLLPPSVAEVATAIPAFLGYTQNGKDLPATRITSLLEYESRFGGPKPVNYDVVIENSGIKTITPKAGYNQYLLYHQVRMYFSNGGGACYIVSLGDYADDGKMNPQDFTNGMSKLRKADEPTLIVPVDAVNLAEVGTGNNKKPGAYPVYEEALSQCAELKDRFTIMDVPFEQVQSFRDKGPADFLSYGAAYTPYLETVFTYAYVETAVKVTGLTNAETTLADLKKGANNSLYNKIKADLDARTITLPPGGAIAGIYARVDRDRGVWKAPANVGVMSIVAPTVRITDKEQEGLNVDPAGKSINAIRSFAGRGTLVWGGRTLAGNDNEWRYVNVRRLFVMMEESIQKSTAFAVFEPNTPTTWLKVKAMIESYLFTIWQRGALAGSSPKQAFFVNVGLGSTMTPDDVLNGRMVVEVGVAASRPAEFIILRFSHKLQEA